MSTIIQLFIEFFKVGLFSIGGGAATIPFLYAISDKTGWFTYTDLANIIAVSEATPGAIGINMATYVGFITASILGGIVATLGLVAPSIVIIDIIAGFLEKFKSSKIVKSAFYGLRPASTGLIAAACIEIVKISLIDLNGFFSYGIASLFKFKEIILAVVVFLLIKKFNKHPVFYIALSAIVGIVFKFGA